jgi:gluconokinase
VATDTLVSNVFGLDAQDRPLTPVFTYADTRNAPDAAQLRAEHNARRVHDRCGCMIHSSYLPARMRWLRRTQPELFPRVNRWVSIGEYLYGVFFGEWRVSYSVASWTGLLDRRTLAWDEEWLALLALKTSQFSALGDLGDALRGLREPWASRWPQLADKPWLLAVGDGAAANIGSGCDRPERVALTVGTSGAMRVVLDAPPDSLPWGLWNYRVDRRRCLLGGATTDGGSVYAWLRETLRLPDAAALEAQLAGMEPCAHGLAFLPFFSGERAPGWRDDARGAVAGLSLQTSPLDLVRAGLEAVALRFAFIHRALAPHLPADHQVIASGAALLASPMWLQMMADVLGRPVTASAEKEGTSRGAAVLALEAMGLNPQPAALGVTYQPDPRRHLVYQAAMDQQAALYDKLLPG